MPPWYVKASVQGILSLLPQNHLWNYFFQRYISRGLQLNSSYFERKLQTCAQHLKHFEMHRNAKPTRVVELGTGWLPVIPVGLFLSGIEAIISVDVKPLLRKKLIQETLQYFIKYADDEALTRFLPDVEFERVEAVRSLHNSIDSFSAKQVLESLHIVTMIQDASKIDLEDIDLVVSNNTLEHIPADTIRAIFQSFRSMLDTEGIMSHLIDLSDHYSHFDHRLTPYNFLRYSAASWRLFNNDLHYQNRLRVSDYREIHELTGFKILYERDEPLETDLIDRIALAPEFQHYDRQDLIVTRSWIVSCPIER